jgi:hypothetical protein
MQGNVQAHNHLRLRARVHPKQNCVVSPVRVVASNGKTHQEGSINAHT